MAAISAGLEADAGSGRPDDLATMLDDLDAAFARLEREAGAGPGTGMQ
ncbi:MAG: hypothetical protein M3527_00230 [Actinomycetota bacterium]|nr:hypothetical protein [Acidimicrobiia bacterium]MDQ3292869.1 hypothetical protein [Actinomycetota bacterium]